MILVVGATGMLGSEICRRLAAAGKPVRALVRATSDPAKVDRLKGYGVEPVQGDLRDPASLEAACKGVSAVVSTVSSMPFSYQPGENDIRTVDTRGAINLIDAARAAGVQHFVYTSFTMELDFPLHNAKRAVEQHLMDSGLAYIYHPAPRLLHASLAQPCGGFRCCQCQGPGLWVGREPDQLDLVPRYR